MCLMPCINGPLCTASDFFWQNVFKTLIQKMIHLFFYHNTATITKWSNTFRIKLRFFLPNRFKCLKFPLHGNQIYPWNNFGLFQQFFARLALFWFALIWIISVFQRLVFKAKVINKGAYILKCSDIEIMKAFFEVD